jgi:hypothetical protein
MTKMTAQEMVAKAHAGEIYVDPARLRWLTAVLPKCSEGVRNTPIEPMLYALPPDPARREQYERDITEIHARDQARLDSKSRSQARPAAPPQLQGTSLPREPKFVPQGPPQPVGPPSLISDTGVVHDHVLGVGYRPRTRFGLEVTDTGLSGQPSTAWSPAGPIQARTLAGTPITGPGGRPLYGRPPTFRPAG